VIRRKVPTDFANYVLASAGAGAALIGLLFVAISINTGRAFGREAQPVRQPVASGAFTALANVFFISTSALIPHLNVGYVTLIMGGIGLVDSLRLGGKFAFGYWRASLAARLRWPVALRALAFVAVSLIPYGYEVVLAVLLLMQPGAVAFVDTLSVIGWLNPLHEAPTQDQPPGA
jgi:hypothetical protein